MCKGDNQYTSLSLSAEKLSVGSVMNGSVIKLQAHMSHLMKVNERSVNGPGC